MVYIAHSLNLLLMVLFTFTIIFVFEMPGRALVWLIIRAEQGYRKA